MIKKMEDWTFTEHQSYSKGILEGTVLGIVISILLALVGLDFWMIYKL